MKGDDGMLAKALIVIVGAWFLFGAIALMAGYQAPHRATYAVPNGFHGSPYADTWNQ